MKDFLNRIKNLGVVGDLTRRENRRVRMLNLCTIVLCCLLLFYAVYNLILGRHQVAGLEFIVACFSLVILALNAKKHYLLAKMVFFFIINGLVFVLSIVVFPGRLLEYVYILNAMLLLIFFNRPLIIYTFYILNIFLFYVPELFFNVYPESVFSYTNPIIIFLTFFVLMRYFIREQINYEKYIYRQNKRLLELNEEKDQLIGIAAHDLKSPLKRIEGLISLIKLSSDNLTEEQKGLIEKVSCVSKDQNKMILEILDLDKIENASGQLALYEINIVDVLDEIISDFQNAARSKEIKITTQFESKELIVAGDIKYLTSIFENILSNAIKFSPSNTNVTVLAKKLQNQICVAIKDQGPGVSNEDKKKLFGRFQKLSAQPTGGEVSTGLGLAITKKYVEAMNGTIRCESDYGDGATFIVEFDKVG